jgi:hypothetical protein
MQKWSKNLGVLLFKKCSAKFLGKKRCFDANHFCNSIASKDSKPKPRGCF